MTDVATKQQRQRSIAGTLFRAGQLQDAVNAAGEAVRTQPMHAASRLLLAEMLLFTGDLDRTDKVLRGTNIIDPAAELAVAEFRQLLRAEVARRQVVHDGRPPEFLKSPTTAQVHLLRALAAMRAGDAVEAERATATAEVSRPRVQGATLEAAFEDFRDADDLWAGTIEVLTPTGKYFWIPAECIATLEPHPLRRARDLFWRRCSMEVRDGPDGDVYLPALYLMPDDATDALRLGQITTWTDSYPIQGRGQRVFLIGDNDVPLHQLPALSFAPHVRATTKDAKAAGAMTQPAP